MFQPGDTIVYGSNGVCRILGEQEESFGGVRQRYYRLRPVGDERSVFYCPVDQAGEKLRPLLTASEVQEWIRRMPDAETVPLPEGSRRRETVSAMLKSGDHAQLIGLIVTLHRHRLEKQAAGKKLHQTDERTLQEAERLLYGEFAHALNIPSETVPDYIRNTLQA